jgi:pimeloyl-ACP methyl ester carboxylesterase
MSAAQVPAGGARLASRWTPVPLRGERVRLHAAWTAPDGATAPPLLLLHGMASSWRQWRGTLLRLGRSLPAAALDFPGFGASDSTRRPLEVDDFVEACEAWCRENRLPSLAAAGHSFGGAVLVRWSALYPGRFRSLGLLAPAAVPHPWHGAGEGPIRWPLARPVLPLLIWLMSTRALGPRYFGHIATDLGSFTEAEYADLQWGCRRAREMLRALDYYRFPSLEDDLRRVRVPVVLGWGTHDRVVPISDAPVFTGNLRDSALRVWQGCGHVPMLERREACDELLADVWRVAAGAAARAAESVPPPDSAGPAAGGGPPSASRAG